MFRITVNETVICATESFPAGDGSRIEGATLSGSLQNSHQAAQIVGGAKTRLQNRGNVSRSVSILTRRHFATARECADWLLQTIEERPVIAGAVEFVSDAPGVGGVVSSYGYGIATLASWKPQGATVYLTYNLVYGDELT